ncbi:UNVERIFIED_CONTAM: glycosyltransferase family 4 protein [Spiribacter pallidus]|jgi:glycosyltransferase involved in cell wall biosynthesis
MASKHLLLVANDPQSFLQFRLVVARQAREAGFEVSVATGPGAGAQRIRDQGLAFYRLPMAAAGNRPLADLYTMLYLGWLFWRLRPDLVHLVTTKPVIYGGLMARLTRVPAMVAAVAGLGYLFTRERQGLRRWLVERLYPLALHHPNSTVIVQNRADQDVLNSLGALPNGRAVLSPGSGVSLETFKAAPLPAGPATVLLAARMTWDKGVGEFVDAARQLQGEGVAARFVLVGDDNVPNPSAIPRATLNRWVDEGIVEWWGYQSDMPAVMRQSTLVVLPSYREGMAKALLEGLATGRPIITTDAPGCREAVDDGWNGLIVPPGDVAALASAIDALVKDPARCQLMGERSRQKAEAAFDVRRVIDIHLGVYRELANRCPA